MDFSVSDAETSAALYLYNVRELRDFLYCAYFEQSDPAWVREAGCLDEALYHAWQASVGGAVAAKKTFTRKIQELTHEDFEDYRPLVQEVIHRETRV